MQPFDVFIAYAPWGDTGKVRPVLVYKLSFDAVFVYRITTQYKSKLLSINDWKQAGLHKPSYIDLSARVKLSRQAFSNKTPIGQLSHADKMRLMGAIVN